MSPTTFRNVTIFHLDDERGFGGGERQLLYLASALRSGGHRNVVCCRHGSALEAEARRQGFEVLLLPFAYEFDLVSAHRLARAAARCAHPVVHAHTGHSVGIAATCQLLGGPPAIAHRRGAAAFRGGFSRWLKYDRVKRVVAVSNAVGDMLRHGGLSAQRIAVVPDCIPVSLDEWRAAGHDHPRFSPAGTQRRVDARQALAAAFGVDPAASWVGNLAALVPLKGHATFVEAAAAVVRRRPNTVFLIGGEGPERERLQADIDHRGLRGKVVLLGHYDAAELFAAIDVFVLSSNREGMGSVLLESAACGVPVAATTVGGIPEVVRDGDTGLLVPPTDPRALSDAITRLLDEPGLAQRVAARAFHELNRFGLTQALGRMESIYESALVAEPRAQHAVPWHEGRFARGLTAAAVILLVVGAATYWVDHAASANVLSRDIAPHLLPATRPPETSASVDREAGISLGGSFEGLSEAELRVLLADVDSLRARPSVEPDNRFVLAMDFPATPRKN